MPFFNEVISKFTVSPKTTQYNSPKFEVLDWMQRHPEELKDTTFKTIAHRMKSDFPNDDEKTLYSRVRQLATEHLFFYFSNRRGGKKTYYLNYFHRKFPASIKKQASEEQLSKVRNMVNIYEKRISSEFTVSPQRPIAPTSTQDSKQNLSKQGESNVGSEKSVIIPIDTKNLPEEGLSVNLNIQFIFNK